MRGWLRANPRIVFLAVAGVVILGMFLAVVTPLFATNGLVHADIAGALPDHAVAGKPLEIDIGLDNTGDPVITPVCVRALTQGPITASYAIFQGLDRVDFHNGRVCGGELSSMESISVQLFFTAASAGDAQVTLAPMEGSRTIGAALSGGFPVRTF